MISHLMSARHAGTAPLLERNWMLLQYDSFYTSNALMSRFKEKVTRENNAADFVTKFVLNSHKSHIVIISITRNKFILLFNCEDKEITTPSLFAYLVKFSILENRPILLKNGDTIPRASFPLLSYIYRRKSAL